MPHLWERSTAVIDTVITGETQPQLRRLQAEDPALVDPGGHTADSYADSPLMSTLMTEPLLGDVGSPWPFLNAFPLLIRCCPPHSGDTPPRAIRTLPSLFKATSTAETHWLYSTEDVKGQADREPEKRPSPAVCPPTTAPGMLFEGSWEGKHSDSIRHRLCSEPAERRGHRRSILDCGRVKTRHIGP